MEIREARTNLRTALLLAKQLISHCGVKSGTFATQRQILTVLRNEILMCRSMEIKMAHTEIADGLQMSSEWLELLRVELCDPNSSRSG